MAEPRPLPDATDPGERKCLADVARVGWHIVHVPPEGNTPGWSFTIGLARTHGHPELVTFGIPQEIAHDVLNAVGEQIKAGARFADGARVAEVLEECDFLVRPVHPRWYKPFLGFAVWFHRGLAFEALQLFWPDGEDDLFPWDPNATDEMRGEQPLLYEEDTQRANASALLASME